MVIGFRPAIDRFRVLEENLLSGTGVCSLRISRRPFSFNVCP